MEEKKPTLLHERFLRFLKCTEGTKSRNTSQMSNCLLPIFHGCFVKIDIKFVKHSANICNKWTPETVLKRGPLYFFFVSGDQEISFYLFYHSIPLLDLSDYLQKS